MGYIDRQSSVEDYVTKGDMEFNKTLTSNLLPNYSRTLIHNFYMFSLITLKF